MFSIFIPERIGERNGRGAKGEDCYLKKTKHLIDEMINITMNYFG